GFAAFNGLINVTIEDSTFHHNTGSHGIYLGSRYAPSKNVTLRRNLLYSNEWNGFQFNGRVTNMVLFQNVAYNNGLSGFSLLQGVKDSFIRSNVAFNNTRAGIIFYNYDGDCYDTSTKQLICPYDQTGNVVENNTIYNTGKGPDGSNAEGQPAIEVVNTVTGKAPDGTQIALAKVG